MHCPQNRTNYLVPIAVLAKGVGSLRVDPTRNGQARGISWAADYALPGEYSCD